MTLLLVLLSGCGGSAASDGSAVRTHFEELGGFEAHLKILSDLEQSVLEYEVDFVYNKEDNDTFTITAPESLAGIGGTIAGTDSASFVLQYDGLELDDAMPQRTGLTPADALFCLLDDLRRAEPAQVWTESTGGVDLLVLRYQQDGDDGKVEKQVWLTEQGYQLVCAELYADGERVLQIQVTSYRET
ncbi:hypothetical protein [uncultured Agathobaculum sp.]|uniref:hypothetical protein n=1 Tax=uncultured Agathobaculum sp. TaxID=2048140 RepID=UPI00320AACD5